MVSLPSKRCLFFSFLIQFFGFQLILKCIKSIFDVVVPLIFKLLILAVRLIYRLLVLKDFKKVSYSFITLRWFHIKEERWKIATQFCELFKSSEISKINLVISFFIIFLQIFINFHRKDSVSLLFHYCFNPISSFF